jgi:Penicillin-insensitive murein endopeptidase
MGWRVDEVWLDTDVLWFREQPRTQYRGLALTVPVVADGLDAALFGPIATGLEASRRRRLAKQMARRRRLTTRTVPAVALVLGSATMIPIAALRQGGAQAGPLGADPPSLTFRVDGGRVELPEAPVPRSDAESGKPTAHATELARVEWRRGASLGLPFSGSLVNGTQLPVEGSNWVTWNPATDSSPNEPARLYGHERTIRTILSVLAAYRAVHPAAPRVVVGDISFRHGRTMDQHVSHQNGLDVDVYYPRLDRRLSAPIASGQIDRRLAQDLLDRFVAAGAQIVFVGYSTRLHGPSGVVVPYPRHENHMHVRFPAPRR